MSNLLFYRYLEDMNIPFLKNYEYYLIKHHNNKHNTVHTDLKSFRRILNEAVNDERNREK